MNTTETLTTTKVTSKATGTAAATIAQYRDAGGGSNRTNWTRMAELLSAVTTVAGTDRAVDITALVPEGSAPLYNVAHRMLSAGAIRPLWHRVRIVVLVNCTTKGTKVTGSPASTATRGGRVFVVGTGK